MRPLFGENGLREKKKRRPAASRDVCGRGKRPGGLHKFIGEANVSFGNGISVSRWGTKAWKAGRLALVVLGFLRAPAGMAGTTCEHATAWPQVKQALAEI